MFNCIMNLSLIGIRLWEDNQGSSAISFLLRHGCIFRFHVFFELELHQRSLLKVVLKMCYLMRYLMYDTMNKRINI